MLEYHFDADANIVTLKPAGALLPENFKELRESVDAYINDRDKIPSLVIESETLPRWDSFEALGEHFKFIRDHHKLIPKVAIVSDSFALSTLPVLMDFFVGAKVRHFTQAHKEAALKWAKEADDHPGEVEILEGFPDDVVAMNIKGIITSQDYTDTILPLLEEKMKVHDKLKFLAILSEDFQSYSGGAAFHDARLGLTYWNRFAKIALVSDIGWITGATRLFGPLIPGKVMVFPLRELEEARSWIKT